MKRSRTQCVIALAAFLVFAAPVRAQVYSLNQIAVTTTDAFFPAIADSGDISWTLSPATPNVAELYYYDATTQTVQNLSATPDDHDIRHRMNDVGDVGWTGLGPAGTADGYVFDKATGTVTLLPPLSAITAFSDINDAGLVAYASRNPAVGGLEDVLTYDLVGGASTQITNDTLRQSFMMLNNAGQIVWPYVSGLQDITVYDIATASLTHLPTPGVTDDWPRINDAGVVVWQGFDGNDQEIFHYSPATGLVTQLTNNAHDDLAPDINAAGDVAWFGFDGSDNEIYLYDASQGVVLQVTDNAVDDFWEQGRSMQRQLNDRGEVTWRQSGVALPSHSQIMVFSKSTGGTVQVSAGGINKWNAINNNGDIVWHGSGPQGVGVVLARLAFVEVGIDIKPGSDPNSINLGSGGNVPLAILSNADLDATTVDPATVTLASAPVRLKGKGTPMASHQDVNGDGLLDLVVHVSTEALELTQDDTQAIVEGKTLDGTAIQGFDTVRIVP